MWHLPMRLRGELRVVRDHQDRRAGRVDLQQQLHDLVRHGRVEVSRGLVGENHARLTRNCARNRRALLLAAGELRRNVLHARGKPTRSSEDRMRRLRSGAGMRR